MSDNERAAWTKEQLRSVRIAEREMQITNGTDSGLGTAATFTPDAAEGI